LRASCSRVVEAVATPERRRPGVILSRKTNACVRSWIAPWCSFFLVVNCWKHNASDKQSLFCYFIVYFYTKTETVYVWWHAC
jgi:hypothetical protein